MSDPGRQSEGAELVDPPASVWTELAMAPEAEVHGGFQSKVFLARGQAGRLIVKLVEASRADTAFSERVDVARQVAEINPAVVGPLAMGTELVVSVDRWNAVCYPYVEGTRPSIGDRYDVETMAATLATLHTSLATLTTVDLPPVAALSEMAEGSLGQCQLIHGDYAAPNLIMTSSGLRVIDFGECGQGSVEVEIGNTLYMVLFDGWHSGTLDGYHRFRSWFVDAYREAASLHVEDALLDEAIRARARALKQWLARPSEAPTGIRTASPVWRQQLQSFVAEVLS